MRRLPCLLALAALLVAPASVAAQTPAPADGKMRVWFSKPYKVLGQRLGVQGERVRVRGSVSRYVPGQVARVTVSRNGRRSFARRARITPAPGGRGQFVIRFTPRRPGAFGARARHDGTLAQKRMLARRVRLRVVSSRVHPGASRAAIALLQRGLARLHFPVRATGYWGGATSRAVLGYRKVNRMARYTSVTPGIFHRVLGRRGGFRPRYRGRRHAEADLSRQVLALVGRGGRVHRVYPISSGTSATPTVLGRYRVYRKEPGVNSHGMIHSSYFYGGYAVHGYNSVPNYPASHGCLRVPPPNALGIYRWLTFGTGVDVYP